MIIFSKYNMCNFPYHLTLFVTGAYLEIFLESGSAHFLNTFKLGAPPPNITVLHWNKN